MALTLKFSICSTGNCQTFQFTETTGTYDASTNPGGWGAPNVDITTALTAILTIVQPDNTVTIIPTSVLYPTLPSDSNTSVTITNVMLGLSADAPLLQGKYTITYDVTGDDGTVWAYSVTTITMIFCSAECCVLTMAGAVRISSDCDCKNKTLQTFNESFGWLQALKAATECGKSNKAQDILDHLTQICAGTNCNCG